MLAENWRDYVSIAIAVFTVGSVLAMIRSIMLELTQYVRNRI